MRLLTFVLLALCAISCSVDSAELSPTVDPAGSACVDALELNQLVSDGALTMDEWVTRSRKIADAAETHPLLREPAKEILRDAVSAHDELDVIDQRTDRISFTIAVATFVQIDCVKAGFITVSDPS